VLGPLRYGRISSRAFNRCFIRAARTRVSEPRWRCRWPPRARPARRITISTYYGNEYVDFFCEEFP
jgi:hypothetical protein